MMNKPMRILTILIWMTVVQNCVNAQTIVWKKLNSFPETTSGAKPVVIDNDIYYIASSYAPRSITPDFYKYDIATDSWKRLADMPEARGNLAVAEVSGNIYAIGGGFTSTNFEYTVATNTWQVCDSMPTVRQHIDCGVVDNKIYVIGGITSFTDITKKNEVYDVKTKTWSEKAPIPTLRNNPAIVTVDSLIYVIGGAGSEKSIWKTISTVECYNPKTDTWSTLSDLPFPIFKPGAVVVNNTIVILGGQNQKGESIASVLIYDINHDTWKETTPLPRINCFAGYAAAGNKIYVIGGTASAPDWTYYSDVYEGTVIDSREQDKKEFPVLKGPYLGQPLPGETPAIFAPEIISKNSWREHCQIAVSPKGDEIYWSCFAETRPEKIYFSTIENGIWTEPAVMDFVKDDSTLIYGSPTLSPDGNRLFFYSRNRPGGFGYIDVWYADRTADGWSKPVNAGKPLNTEGDDRPPIITKKGNAYTMGRNFTENKVDFLKFSYNDGVFSSPSTVNIYKDSPSWWPLYVSPDERYIIFPSPLAGGFGGLDLYISFKDDHDNWEEPINLGPDINTGKSERFPVVSPDGNYLFFMRHTETWDIFWVSTKVIQNLKKN